jgi:cation diffusion facilitator family transporter
VQERRSLLRFAWLSILAAVVTIGLKGGAYLLTGSVGLLSDALESLVNLVAAVAALVALAFATRPPDEEHAYGHDKAEYFSSGFEGALILVAAAGIAWAAVERFLYPQPLGAVGPALAVSALASLVNFGVARVLRRAGREHGSITLEADAEHLMADVWTSVVVIAGVAAVAFTGWGWLDPLLALAVAANVLRTGVDLLRRSGAGLLDAGLPPEERAAIQDVLDAYAAEGLRFHALRTRQAGARRFASVHVLVPGAWTVQRGHNVVEQIEGDLRSRLPNLSVVTHLEPVEDPVSWADVSLDRADRA